MKKPSHPMHFSRQTRGLCVSAGFLLPALLCSAQTVSPPVMCGFEAPDFRPGSIDGQRGWSVQQGKAEIVTGEARSGAAALKLFPADPFSQAKLSLSAAVPPSTVMFVDFYARPVASVKREEGEFLDVDGARIGFFRDPKDERKAVIAVFHGDASGGGKWMETSLSVPVDAASGVAREWVRFTLREDFARQIWDLRVDGALAGANLGFQEAQVPHTQAYIIMGDAAQPVLLDDLLIDRSSPLGLDTDADGFADADEKKSGSDPLFDDRDNDADGDGVTLLEQAVAKGGTAVGEGDIVLPPEPQFSSPGGLVDGPVTLTLSPQGSAVSILFTTDGSDPHLSRRKVNRYDKPLSIEANTVIRAIALDARGRSSRTQGAAFVFPAKTAGQAAPEGFPAVLEDTTYFSASLQRFALQTSFAAEGAGDVAAALRAAPCVVVSTAAEALFDPVSGIYSRSSLSGPGHTAPVSVQWLSAGASAAAPVEASAAISGQSSRHHDVTLKHSLRLTFGEGGTDAAIAFGSEKPVTVQKLLLRNPTHDSFALGGYWAQNRKSAKYVADAWANEWLGQQGHRALERRFVHVFLNGAYWGVYEAIEQHDAFSAGRRADAADTLLEAGENAGSPVQAVAGTTDEWKAMMTAVAQCALGGENTPPQSWAAAVQNIDLASLIDYVFINAWMTNLDWPERNFLIEKSGGRFRFVNWDAEFSLRETDGWGVDVLQRVLGASDGPGRLFTLLLAWPEFRAEVRARYAAAAAGGGALHPASLDASFSRTADRFRPLVAAEAARWSGVYDTPPVTTAEWERRITWVREQYIPGRCAVFPAMLEEMLKIATAAPPVDNGKPTRQGGGPVTSITPRADADGDGIPDAWEKAHGLAHRDASDAAGDADHDGLSNLEEYLLGTDPRTANERTAHVRKDDGGIYRPLRAQNRSRWKVAREAAAAAVIDVPATPAADAPR